jgi:hypothetical protein
VFLTSADIDECPASCPDRFTYEEIACGTSLVMEMGRPQKLPVMKFEVRISEKFERS